MTLFVQPVGVAQSRLCTGWLRLAGVVSGVGMVFYLVYAELFQIDAICIYCTAVCVITVLLFAVVVSAFCH